MSQQDQPGGPTSFEDFVWQFLVPQACEHCGQPYTRDLTTVGKAQSGRLAVKCAHCGYVLSYGFKPVK